MAVGGSVRQVPIVFAIPDIKFTSFLRGQPPSKPSSPSLLASHSGRLHPHVAKHLSVVHFDSGGYASWRHKMQRAAESNGYTYEECERKVG